MTAFVSLLVGLCLAVLLVAPIVAMVRHSKRRPERPLAEAFQGEILSLRDPRVTAVRMVRK